MYLNFSLSFRSQFTLTNLYINPGYSLESKRIFTFLQIAIYTCNELSGYMKMIRKIHMIYGKR